jgi:hypothetical protein
MEQGVQQAANILQADHRYPERRLEAVYGRKLICRDPTGSIRDMRRIGKVYRMLPTRRVSTCKTGAIGVYVGTCLIVPASTDGRPDG